MKSREELIKQQEHLLKVHGKVAKMLSDYANVVEVEIGIKETKGRVTEEGCIKIFVKEKVGENDLNPDQLIPKEVEGVATDIVIVSDKVKVEVCETDTANYRPLKGGIKVNNYRNGNGSGGSGTLGCFGQLNSDNSWVLLSNHHVLYGDNGQDGDDIGQPWVGCSWCCKSNVIATNLDKDETLDCAIAKIKDDIGLQNLIADVGTIQGGGAVAAVNGERVRKKGSRTGYTSGTITAINVTTKEITITANTAGGDPSADPGGCTNYESGRTIFGYFGDSGSVVANDNNEIIGLFYAIDSATHSQGFAMDILQVQTALNFTIKTSSAQSGKTPAFQEIDELNIAQTTRTNTQWLDEIRAELDASFLGTEINEQFGIYEEEVFGLIQKCRPVTSAWHRKQGPAYLAAVSRSYKNRDYEIPEEINDVTFLNLLMSMASVLEENGSESLRIVIKEHIGQIIESSKNCKSTHDFLEIISQVKKNKNLKPQHTLI